MSRSPYQIASVSHSSYLVDASGHGTGPEILRVLARPRTLEAAYHSLCREQRRSPLSRVCALHADGSHLTTAEQRRMGMAIFDRSVR